MKVKLLKVVLSFFVVLLLFGFSGAALAFDPEKDSGLVTTARWGYTKQGDKAISQYGIMTRLESVIGSTIGAALSLLGVAFMLLIIYGGFIWMFARGNDQAVAKAKSIIEAAIIGLVIVLAAYAITSFIGTSLTT